MRGFSEMTQDCGSNCQRNRRIVHAGGVTPCLNKRALSRLRSSFIYNIVWYWLIMSGAENLLCGTMTSARDLD